MPSFASSLRTLVALTLLAAGPSALMAASGAAHAQSNDWRTIARGTRGYTDPGRRSPGRECRSRYTFDLQMNGNADLRFRSDGRTYFGHYFAGNGQITFEQRDIRPRPRSAFRIDGELFPGGSIGMFSGFCGNGFWTVDVPNADLFAAYERAGFGTRPIDPRPVEPRPVPSGPSGSGWVTFGQGERGYTDPGRRSPGGDCRSRYTFRVQTNANLSRLRFRSDGRTFTGDYNDFTGEFRLDRRDVRPRPRSAFSMNGNIDGGSMFSGFCGNGYFVIRRR